MNWLILFLGVLSNALASVLIKMAVTNANLPFQITKPLAFISNMHLIFGIFLYTISLLFYSISLIYLPLNIAHPTLAGGSISLVAIFSFVYFGESISIVYLAGIFLIILGIFCLAVD